MVVYVPPGDYVITATLPLYFLTHLVGNSLCPPTLIVPPHTMTAAMTFVLSGDTSYDGEHDDEFYRGVRHIDIVFGAGNVGGCGVHWAESQATFLRDMVIDLGADGQFGVFDVRLRAAPSRSRPRANERDELPPGAYIYFCSQPFCRRTAAAALGLTSPLSAARLGSTWATSSGPG
jgi:hypothetical protein